MAQIEIKVSGRDVLGKNVRFLRRQNITPVHVFGHGLESLALQCETAKLERSLTLGGESRLISLKVDGEKQARPVLVREIQRDPLKGKLLHVDFYQVKMGEKVEVEVPIILVGEAPALTVKGTTLLQELNTLTIECLPDKIPANLELNIGAITEPGHAIRVKDIAVDPGVTVLTDPEQVVVTVTVARVEEQPVVEEAPVTAEEAPPAAGKEKAEAG
ncbi:MAG: 50S ribosomal protein L25 [Dehalococcoidales bacterium]|nr:50S ribosomal protein L25 [Dehalococcoidales bacterium]